MRNKKLKRLNIEIDLELHQDIKRRAKFRSWTIRRWLLSAIFDKIKREKATE